VDQRLRIHPDLAAAISRSLQGAEVIEALVVSIEQLGAMPSSTPPARWHACWHP